MSNENMQGEFYQVSFETSIRIREPGFNCKLSCIHALSLNSTWVISPYRVYCMSKKSWPNLQSNLLYNSGQYLLDILYLATLLLSVPGADM